MLTWVNFVKVVPAWCLDYAVTLFSFVISKYLRGGILSLCKYADRSLYHQSVHGALKAWLT